jgi:hypothetical protein
LPSFCTGCGSTEPSTTGRRRRLPRNEHNEITGFPQHSGKGGPCRDDGGGEIARFFLRALNQRDCACNIDPPASSYAIMRVGAYVVLTTRRYASGEVDWTDPAAQQSPGPPRCAILSVPSYGRHWQ